MSNNGFYSGDGDGRQDFTVKGLKELNDALDQFPEKLQRNVLRGAIRAALKIILDDAAARVSVISGLLKKSLRISVRIVDGNVVGTLKAGGGVNVKTGDKKNRRVAFYAHMVEFGTAAHVIRAIRAKALSIGGYFARDISHPGAQEKPFMRPAIAAKTAAATEAFADYVRVRLDKLNRQFND